MCARMCARVYEERMEAQCLGKRDDETQKQWLYETHMQLEIVVHTHQLWGNENGWSYTLILTVLHVWQTSTHCRVIYKLYNHYMYVLPSVGLGGGGGGGMLKCVVACPVFG